MGARYSRHTGYTISRRPTRRPTIRTVQRTVRFGPTAAKYFAITVVAALAIIMLTQSSTSSTNAYKQNDLRKEAGKVSQDIERLQLEAQRAQSIQAIQQTEVKNQMEPGQDAQYIEAGEVAGVSTAQP